VRHGVSVVKLMGRHGGFIACHAAIALNDVDFVLIPEVPFAFDGEQGLLAQVEERVHRRGHALVVVAEGAGQEHIQDMSNPSDAGAAEAPDIGAVLSDRIERHLIESGYEPVMRYLDPSYAIRSVRANTYDSIYCVRLAHAAVHAAMAGRTASVVAQWRQRLVLVPMSLMTRRGNQVDPGGELWATVLEATRQPTRLDSSGVSIGPKSRTL
jgi:6-phosphofructokinase 1